MKKTKKKKYVSKKSQYRRNSKAVIKRAISDGFENEIIKALGTLDVNELVKSKKGHEKVKQVIKEIRGEKKSLVKEALKISDKQLDELRTTYGQRAINTMRRDRTYKGISLFGDFKSKKHSADDVRMMIHEMKSVSGVTHYKTMMRAEIDDYFDDYFREVRLNAKYKHMLQDMKDYFADTDALSDFFDFADYIGSAEFKGPYYPDKNDIDEYESMMVDRLHRAMDAMINNTYKI